MDTIKNYTSIIKIKGAKKMNFEEYNPFETNMDYNNEPEQPKKEKKPKKHGRAKKVFTAIICAILLGAIAGGTCYGVSYAGYKLFPIKDKAEETKSEEKTTAQQLNYEKKEIKASVLDVSDIVDSVISSVVAISGTYTSTQQGIFGSQQVQAKVSGSGIIIGESDGELLVVTNAHVVENISKPTIVFYDGTEVEGIVKGTKEDKDLAVIAVSSSIIPKDAIYSIAKMGESDKLKVGEAAIAIGNSMGTGISVTSGCVSALNRTLTVEGTNYEDLIQTDAAINSGNSGGPLFNSDGEVIGIVSCKIKTTAGAEGMGYAISISSVKEIIESLSTIKKLPDDERGYLGVTGVTISEDINMQYGYPMGILVRSVDEKSAADNAGIRKNDIIVSFDGEELKSFDQLYSLMSAYEVGQEVEVEYYTIDDKGEYQKKKVTVKLTPKSGNK